MQPDPDDRRRPTPGDLVDLSRQLAEDRERPGSALRHRDRAIGRGAARSDDRPEIQLLGWLRRVRPAADDPVAERVDLVHRVGLLGLAVAGALVGWGTAAVVFHYDGTHPVNVIHVLAVFVLLQLLLLLLFGFGLLPVRVTGWVPGMRTLQETLGWLSPGRVQRLLARRLGPGGRERMDRLFGRGLAHQRLYGRVERWVVIHSSQTFAVFFQLGALASALYLVAFSDLAFSWSTTLELEASELRRMTDLLSAPWAAFFAEGRPDASLIASTRYFRLQDGSFPAPVTPGGLGGWWPFLMACMAVYGLLPRLLLWLLARQRLAAAVTATLRNFPGADEVLARLNTELVETRSDDPDPGGAPVGGDAGSAQTAASLSGEADVVVWSGALPDADTARRWFTGAVGVEAGSTGVAGGVRSPEEDLRAIDGIGARTSTVVVLVRAFEPPVEDLLDFLRALRERTSPTRRILVAPVGAPDAAGPSAATSAQLETWRRAVGRLGDPWTSILETGGRA